MPLRLNKNVFQCLVNVLDRKSIVSRQYNFLPIHHSRSAKLFIEKLENFQLIAIFVVKLLSAKNLLLIILLFVLSNLYSHHSLPACLKIDEHDEFYFLANNGHYVTPYKAPHTLNRALIGIRGAVLKTKRLKEKVH